eukprot:1935327-Ditylum_brightwellii.AAC.1
MEQQGAILLLHQHHHHSSPHPEHENILRDLETVQSGDPPRLEHAKSGDHEAGLRKTTGGGG